MTKFLQLSYHAVKDNLLRFQGSLRHSAIRHARNCPFLLEKEQVALDNMVT